MGETSRGVAEDIFEDEEDFGGAYHDIHEDDLDFNPEEDMSVEEEEGSQGKTNICAPTPVIDLEAGIIYGWQKELL